MLMHLSGCISVAMHNTGRAVPHFIGYWLYIFSQFKATDVIPQVLTPKEDIGDALLYYNLERYTFFREASVPYWSNYTEFACAPDIRESSLLFVLLFSFSVNFKYSAILLSWIHGLSLPGWYPVQLFVRTPETATHFPKFRVLFTSVTTNPFFSSISVSCPEYKYLYTTLCSYRVLVPYSSWTNSKVCSCLSSSIMWWT